MELLLALASVAALMHQTTVNAICPPAESLPATTADNKEFLCAVRYSAAGDQDEKNVRTPI